MPTAAKKDRGYTPPAENPGQQFGPYGQHNSATEAAVECFRTYARERPEAVAMWAFGIGFVLGWKLRIW